MYASIHSIDSNRLFNLFELVLQVRILFGYESIRPVSVGIWLIKPSKTLNVVGAIHLPELRPPPTVATSDQRSVRKNRKTETKKKMPNCIKIIIIIANKMRNKHRERLDADAANKIRKELPNATVASIDRFVSSTSSTFSFPQGLHVLAVRFVATRLGSIVLCIAVA